MTSSIVCFLPEVAFPDSSSDVVAILDKYKEVIAYTHLPNDH